MRQRVASLVSQLVEVLTGRSVKFRLEVLGPSSEGRTISTKGGWFA